MRKTAYLLAIAVLFFFSSCKKHLADAASDIEWSKIYGGSGVDMALGAVESTNGSYIIVGYTNSNDGDMDGKNHCLTVKDMAGTSSVICGQEDGWALKLSRSGSTLWQYNDGGTSVLPFKATSGGNVVYNVNPSPNSDRFMAITPAAGRSYILAGQTNDTKNTNFIVYFPESAVGIYNPTKIWLEKIGEDGSLSWKKILDGSFHDTVKCIKRVTDKGFVLVGSTDDHHHLTLEKYQHSNVFAATYKDVNAYIIFVDTEGVRLWGTLLGGSGFDSFNSVMLDSADGSFIAVGQSTSTDQDLTGNHGGSDVWMVKIDAAGNKVWSKLWGGEGNDIANCIISTDHGFIVAGQTSSNDQDVSGNHSSNYDALVIRFDASGNKLWQKTYGGAFGDDMARSIVQTPDGGFAIAGQTSSNDGDVKGNHGFSDAWIVKIDKDGKLLWQQTLGGSSADGANEITTTSDGGLLVSGYSFSNDGNISRFLANGNLWVVKLNKH